MSKDVLSNILRFKSILSELMETPTGLILEGDRIILPWCFYRGSHPRLARMEIRLRLHSFYDM